MTTADRPLQRHRLVLPNNWPPGQLLCIPRTSSIRTARVAGRKSDRIEISPDRSVESKRFCFMYLVVASAWAWLKGIFAKTSSRSPRGIFISIRKKSHRGDEFALVVSTHDAETVSRLFQSPAASVPRLRAAPRLSHPLQPRATAPRRQWNRIARPVKHRLCRRVERTGPRRNRSRGTA